MPFRTAPLATIRPIPAALSAVAVVLVVAAAVRPSLAVPILIGAALFGAFWLITRASMIAPPGTAPTALIARGVGAYLLRMALAFATLAAVGGGLGGRALVAAVLSFGGLYLTQLFATMAVAVYENERARREHPSIISRLPRTR